MEPADLLEKAAELIETVGHIKGQAVKYGPHNTHLAYCATGAIWEAAGLRDLSNNRFPHLPSVEYAANLAALAAMASFLEPHETELLLSNINPGVRIVNWNDAEERTADEVIDLMKHAAKDLRNRKVIA